MTIRHYAMCVLMVLVVVTFAEAYTWSATTSLPVGRRDAALVFYNGYIYCVGGRTPAEAVSPNPRADATVYYAKVNNNGSIGAWNTANPLPEALASHGAAAYNGYLYAWGGWEVPAAYPTSNNCYYAPIQPDGSLGAWVTSAVTIPNDGADAQMDAFGQGVMVFNGVLYIVNGEDNAGAAAGGLHAETLYSKIQGSHDFGTWATTTSTPNASWFHGVAICEGTSANYIYRIAGNLSGSSEIDSYYNTINPDGTLGATWTQTTGSLPAGNGRWEFACAFADNKIFIVAGMYSSTPQTTVYYGDINPATGDIASWTLDSGAYPIAVGRNQAIGYSIFGSEYILGVSGGGGYLSTDPINAGCYYSLIKAGPTPTPSPTPVGFTAVESPDWALYE